MHRAGAACQEDRMSLGTGQVWSGGEEHPQVTGEDATRGQEQTRQKAQDAAKQQQKRRGGGLLLPLLECKVEPTGRRAENGENTVDRCNIR